MERRQETLCREDNKKEAVLYTAFELSSTQWKLAFSKGDRTREVTVVAGDLIQFERELIKAKKRFQMSEDVRMVSCYEAGRDGFWLHRYLVSRGIENLIVDSASIEVDRRKRRTKTDRIDVRKLLSMLVRYHDGDRRVWRVVRVPSVEEEDARNLNRDWDVLKRERTLHRNRIRGLLAQQGVQVSNPSKKDFLKELESLRTWNHQPLPADLTGRIVREYERLRLVEDHLRGLDQEKDQSLKQLDTASLQKVAYLRLLPGIGKVSSWAFVMEFFGWRKFRNRREVAALAGLCPTPYASGRTQREQGISKAGSPRIRTLAIEIAWAWLRFQPQSKLSRWYMDRFASGGSRMRRIGIVAMARRLLVDLWRYLEYGIIPEGARVM